MITTGFSFLAFIIFFASSLVFLEKKTKWKGFINTISKIFKGGKSYVI